MNTSSAIKIHVHRVDLLEQARSGWIFILKQSIIISAKESNRKRLIQQPDVAGWNQRLLSQEMWRADCIRHYFIIG